MSNSVHYFLAAKTPIECRSEGRLTANLSRSRLTLKSEKHIGQRLVSAMHCANIRIDFRTGELISLPTQTRDFAKALPLIG